MRYEVAVILAAGGSSSRFGRNKLFELIDGVPVIVRTIEAFGRTVRTFGLHGFYIATSPETHKHLVDLSYRLSPGTGIQFVEGGPTRAHSVQNALRAVPRHVDYVAIHDAARPLVSAELIERTYAQAALTGAAAPAMPVHLTIKEAHGPLPAPVLRTVPRQTLFAMQTPQVMRRGDLVEAFSRCPVPLEQITDDVQLLELAGYPVTLITGEERNLKITTPLDLHLASLLLHTAG